MIKPGQYAALKDGRTVVVLSIDGNKALVRCFRNQQGDPNPVKMRISMSELTELTPVMQGEIRKRSVENRKRKRDSGIVPAVPVKRHAPPAIRRPHQNDPVCPECGAQGYVDGVKCPNCEHISGMTEWRLPTFKSWLESQP